MNDSLCQTQPATGRGIRKVLVVLGALLLMGAALYPSYFSQPTVPVAVANDLQDKKPAPSAVNAANAFLDSLDPKLKEKALYTFDSDKKPNWSNLPVTMVPRNGARLGDLSKEQRDKAMGVLAAVLSKDGYQKVIDIMDGDQKLVSNDGPGGSKTKSKGGDRGPMFGKDLYYLAIFGTPSETKPWMVQFGGHHLGVNVTVIGKNFILTPTHTGAQPSLFKRGNTEVRPLGREIDTAFKLMDSLNAQQRAQAIISERAQGELLLGPGRDGRKIEPKGIKGSALTREQQAQLLEVIAAWVNIVETDAATARMESIKEKINDTWFAWSGPVENGKAAYFRIQGPTVVIEYAPQNGTGHIHTVIRNPQDDYGVGESKK